MLALSPAQELWMYAHLKKKERKVKEEQFDLFKLLCMFVNYPMAKEYFTEPESTTNVGFLDDLKAIDPNFDASKYEEYLEDSN